MRHGKWRELQAAQIDHLTVTRGMQQAIEIRCANCGVRSLAHPHRNAVAKCQGTGATDMVAVFVGDKNRVDVLGLQSRFG